MEEDVSEAEISWESSELSVVSECGEVDEVDFDRLISDESNPNNEHEMEDDGSESRSRFDDRDPGDSADRWSGDQRHRQSQTGKQPRTQTKTDRKKTQANIQTNTHFSERLCYLRENAPTCEIINWINSLYMQSSHHKHHQYIELFPE